MYIESDKKSSLMNLKKTATSCRSVPLGLDGEESGTRMLYSRPSSSISKSDAVSPSGVYFGSRNIKVPTLQMRSEQSPSPHLSSGGEEELEDVDLQDEEVDGIDMIKGVTLSGDVSTIHGIDDTGDGESHIELAVSILPLIEVDEDKYSQSLVLAVAYPLTETGQSLKIVFNPLSLSPLHSPIRILLWEPVSNWQTLIFLFLF
tara:strand:+ start:242 stop:850 length:609 start_codon:yes stop_codon:yes gene_type:complete